jgi:predicted nucleic acid-binding protein
LRLFDTTFIVDLVNSDPGAIELAKIADEEASLAAVSVVSVHEYLFGIYFRYRNEEEPLKAKLVSARNDLERFEVIPMTREVTEVSSKMHADLATGGKTDRN